MIFAMGLALATLLPAAPHPASPFPAIITDASTIDDVAPGVAFGSYEMRTDGGPLSVHVIAIDLSEPSVHVGAALAHDRLVSAGETVSSMAVRNGAVAGINGDYFDINQTNQPLNILVQNGAFERMPMHRWAIAIDGSKHATFAEFTVSLAAQIGTVNAPVRSINEWPPPGGRVSLITPVFGPIKAAANISTFQLQPTNGTPPFAVYRVTGIADNSIVQPAGYYLAVGPNVYGSFPLPNNGDTVAITGELAPSIPDLQTAIGGGPLLVRDGRWYADPDGPNTGEFLTHMPASGAAVTADGRLLFFEIDGRQPALSIGVLQPQLAALMIAFGATTGMQFDGGGSSTIVARAPGDARASVRNSPSDGQERNVADGLFVYSDAPQGPPARIAAVPHELRVFPGAREQVKIAVVDTGDHPANDAAKTRVSVQPPSLGTFANGTFSAHSRTGNGVLRVTHGALHFNVPVDVTQTVAYAQILPNEPAVPLGGALKLSVRAFDRGGYPIALPAALPWRTNSGTIDAAGSFHASSSDAAITLRLGSFAAQQRIVVGEHSEAIALAEAARFITAPQNDPGSLAANEPCEGCVTLRYDFTGSERAAYAQTSLTLRKRALGLSADVFGDGNGETLRIAVNNAINERFLYTVASVTWHGWRHVEFRFPPELPQPLTLKALYVINRVGPEPPVTKAGYIAIRKPQVILAGSEQRVPK